MITMNAKSVPVEIEKLIPAKSEKVFLFLDAWKRARNGALVPLRQDIDPLRFVRILSAVWIYQFDPGCGDFICQLAGEDINTAWERNIKGTGLKDIVADDNHDAVLARWHTILSEPNLEYSIITEYTETRIPYQIERLLLPLATAPDQRDCVMGLTLFDSRMAGKKPSTYREDVQIQIPVADIS